MFVHKSVLFDETIEALAIRPEGIYVDGTLGGGGHSFGIAQRLTEGGRLIGIDRDEDAIAAAAERLRPYADRVTLIRGNYEDTVRIVKEDLGIPGIDGMLLDLGVSSYQFDEAERGFSYREEAPLDMRMDRRDEKSAYEVVNNYPENELYRIIRDYGEDRFAKTGHTGPLQRGRRPSGKEDLSGHPDRGEQGTGYPAGFPGGPHGSSESGRQALHHYLPQSGRSDRKIRLPQGRGSMYLPAGFSGLRLWQEIKRKDYHQETHRFR